MNPEDIANRLYHHWKSSPVNDSVSEPMKRGRNYRLLIMRGEAGVYIETTPDAEDYTPALQAKADEILEYAFKREKCNRVKVL